MNQNVGLSQGSVRPFRRPLYAVLFSSPVSTTEPYSPIVSGPQDATRPHGFDREMATVVPGLWYCLHLPNTPYELMDLPLSTVKKFQDFDAGHLILVCPIQVFDDRNVQWAEAYAPALTVCPDNLLEEASRRAQSLGFLMGAIGYSALSDETLRRHWGQVQTNFGEAADYLGKEPRLSARADLAVSALPKNWLARQLGIPRVEPAPATSSSDDVDESLQQHLVLSSFARMEDEGLSQDEAQRRLPDVAAEERLHLQIPVTLAIPGVPSGYWRKVLGMEAPEPTGAVADPQLENCWAADYMATTDFDIEQRIIEFLTVHRAIARTGFGLVMPPIPEEAFHVLARLEDHMRERRPRARVVWRLLNELNETCSPWVTEALEKSIGRASMITAFTNFPLGLLRLFSDTDPLCCRTPIAYRPLMPLTTSIQQELQTPASIDLTQGLRLLIAECIPSEDDVGRASRDGWEVALQLVGESSAAVTVHHEEAGSIEDLRRLIATSKPHVLVLSAHGIFDKDSNSAGIQIGQEVCLGPEIGAVPPIVLLSACTVAPRGIGTVNIADMLLRRGAYAVLGAQIPVHVRHNATLMVRFLLYILESLAGREPHRTLLDAWHTVRTTNAIIDILNGNRRLLEWAYTPRGDGKTILQLFMEETTAKNLLQMGHIYRDSEQVLLGLADEVGMASTVHEWLRNPGYVPESLFYGFVGRPERVLLQH